MLPTLGPVHEAVKGELLHHCVARAGAFRMTLPGLPCLQGSSLVKAQLA